MASPEGKKQRSKKRRKPQRKTNYLPWILGGVAIVALLAAPRLQQEYKFRTASDDFTVLARAGRGNLGLEERYANLGQTHVAIGTEVDYNSEPATSGPHYGSWINPGFYTEVQEERQMVHSLEHGHVIAYYGNVSNETLDTLEDWSRRFSGNWDGVLAAPLPDIGEAVIMTAWRHTLRLDPFDAATAAAFIDKHRGRGPENPVR